MVWLRTAPSKGATALPLSYGADAGGIRTRSLSYSLR